MKVSIKDFFRNKTEFKFTEEILNGKLHFFVQWNPWEILEPNKTSKQ